MPLEALRRRRQAIGPDEWEVDALLVLIAEPSSAQRERVRLLGVHAGIVVGMITYRDGGLLLLHIANRPPGARLAARELPGHLSQ